MEIYLKKGTDRTILTCKRENGTSTYENLGPSFPNHDIAHFVVETQFKLEKGFFGYIKAGMTIAELSDKNIIKNLDAEVWLAEILARNLQALGSSASTMEQYIELVNLETKNMSGIKVPYIDLKVIVTLKKEFDNLCEKWDSLSENNTLKLIF